MLSRFNAIDIESALRAATPSSPFPPASDRAAWNEVRAAIPPETVTDLVAQAEAAAAQPLEPLPATLYLEFVRNGQREGYEKPARSRRERLLALVLAESLEGQGRFLEPALDLAWAMCEESAWAWPAHQRELTNMQHPVIDLSAAMTALALAETDALLGDRLDPALGARIRYEVDRRCFTPYLTRHDHWWLYNSTVRNVNNWTAVCNAGVVGAAIYLEPDASRLAEMIARAARSLDDYLATFDPDGGSSEGPGYWSYGFGYFTLIAHLVEHRTAGKISFWEGDHVRQIARYPLRVALSPGAYVNFSDADRDFRFVPAHLAYLARRLDLPDLMRLARQENGRRRELQWGLRSLFWRPSPEPAGHVTPAAHDWFSGMMWMFARHNPADPQALVLAAKGGHNGEMHNQNDVGNIIVHVGGESVIADVGRGRYTRFYFGPERYDHFVNSSLGHSVPVPNGQAQRPGRDYHSTLLDHQADAGADTLAIEMKDAYPAEADLQSLQRVVTLHRASPRGHVELVDRARFASGAGRLESVLTTFGTATVEPSSVVLRGDQATLRVGYDSAVVTARVEEVKDVDLSEGRRDVRRVVFALTAPAQEATIRLTIEPM